MYAQNLQAKVWFAKGRSSGVKSFTCEDSLAGQRRRWGGGGVKSEEGCLVTVARFLCALPECWQNQIRPLHLR